MNKKIILIFVTLILILAGSGFGYWYYDKNISGGGVDKRNNIKTSLEKNIKIVNSSDQYTTETANNLDKALQEIESDVEFTQEYRDKQEEVIKKSLEDTQKLEEKIKDSLKNIDQGETQETKDFATKTKELLDLRLEGLAIIKKTLSYSGCVKLTYVDLANSFKNFSEGIETVDESLVETDKQEYADKILSYLKYLDESILKIDANLKCISENDIQVEADELKVIQTNSEKNINQVQTLKSSMQLLIEGLLEEDLSKVEKAQKDVDTITSQELNFDQSEYFKVYVKNLETDLEKITEKQNTSRVNVKKLFDKITEDFNIKIDTES